MSIGTSLDGCAVLLHSVAEGVVARIHRLIADGARVTVLNASPSPQLVDLAGRGLIEVTTDADPLAFDLVMRDRAPDRPTDLECHNLDQGRVVLVGGGPGDEGLITIAGMQAIRAADVVVCDRLAPMGVLSHARPQAEVIHVGKIPRGEFTPQEAINDILVSHAKEGRYVVRLKGGDSFVFGRGGEEWNACVAAGVPVEVIPGISSSIAAPSMCGIPVTHRSVTQGFVVVSGHVTPDDQRNAVNWTALAASGMTIVVMMGVATLKPISARLIADGMSPQTPAACIADASMPSQRVVTATLADIADKAGAAGIGAPAVTIIGDVVTALER